MVTEILTALQGLSLAEWLSIGVPVAALVWGGFQWLLAERRRHQERDVELVRWAGEAIHCFARAEQFCRSGRDVATVAAAREIAMEASALVDRGRLFFPNVKRTRSRRNPDARRAGHRPAVLSELLRVYFVAMYAAEQSGEGLERFIEPLWEARTRFVTSIQREMGRSLRETPRDMAGRSIDSDPTKW